MSPVTLYVNFVLHAVLGRLAEADALMLRFGPAIRHVAAALRARYPFEVKPLHRGIVLDGAFDPTGREFVSWSEDPDVAGWFADPRSMMNEPMMAMHPRSTGYLLTAPRAERVLFHHSWCLQRAARAKNDEGGWAFAKWLTDRIGDAIIADVILQFGIFNEVKWS